MNSSWRFTATHTGPFFKLRYALSAGLMTRSTGTTSEQIISQENRWNDKTCFVGVAEWINNPLSFPSHHMGWVTLIKFHKWYFFVLKPSISRVTWSVRRHRFSYEANDSRVRKVPHSGVICFWLSLKIKTTLCIHELFISFQSAEIFLKIIQSGGKVSNFLFAHESQIRTWKC